ncbi:kinesin-like protein KIN-5D [Tanacetum coccineum]|uniref:Kinesin-like protein KIN-5D n=1 Tax=Tanacetum coccineum TaxID=301880 RepID=A0ABQ5GDQ0_9ASTR
MINQTIHKHIERLKDKELHLLKTWIEDSLQLDHSAYQNLDSMIVPCCGELKELKGGHYDKIAKITDNAGKTLLSD